MYYVKKLEIDGLWGSKKGIDLSFDRHVNFLIGQNGSGKTTIIELLASLLKADHANIAKLDFVEAIVSMQETTRGPNVQIKAKRVDGKNRGSVRVTFKGAESEQWVELKARSSEPWQRSFTMHFSGVQEVRAAEPEIPEIIKNLINVYWLPLNRTANSIAGKSLIDAKLNEISVNIGAYLSSLDSQAARETKLFEEYVFLALLATKEDRYNPMKKKIDINVINEKNALDNIFKQFALSEFTYQNKLNEHSSAVMQALNAKNSNSDGPMLIDDYATLRDSLRIDQLIKEWTATQNRISNIYNKKSSFIEIINEMLSNKQMKIDERNRPVVNRGGDRGLSLESLSSGEKQLFILLGEALRQEGEPSTYIADEPELSLHVDWQSKLVSNMLLLNDNMQVIFATHSPDIVAKYSKNVIHVDKKTNALF